MASEGNLKHCGIVTVFYKMELRRGDSVILCLFLYSLFAYSDTKAENQVFVVGMP